MLIDLTFVFMIQNLYCDSYTLDINCHEITLISSHKNPLTHNSIPFNVHPPYGWVFLKGDSKSRFWGVKACRHPLISAIFLRGKVKIYKFLRGVLCRHFDLFFLGVKILLTSSVGVWVMVECRGSRVIGRGSRVISRGSRVIGQGSRVKSRGRGSKVEGQKSRVKSRGRGSKVEGRKSKILNFYPF
jgi:hypothetical protein